MKEKIPEKIEAIHNATLQLTGKIGIAGLKISDIAKEAKIAIGTLYIYFKSKEDLLNDLYKNLKNRTVDALQNNKADKDIAYKLKFKKHWFGSLKYRIEHFEEIIFMEQFYYSPFISEENKMISQKYKTYIEAILEEGKAQLLVKDIDNSFLIQAMAGLSREFSLSYVDNPSKIDDKFLENSFTICWDAIKI